MEEKLSIILAFDSASRLSVPGEGTGPSSNGFQKILSWGLLPPFAPFAIHRHLSLFLSLYLIFSVPLALFLAHVRLLRIEFLFPLSSSPLPTFPLSPSPFFILTPKTHLREQARRNRNFDEYCYFDPRPMWCKWSGASLAPIQTWLKVRWYRAATSPLHAWRKGGGWGEELTSEGERPPRRKRDRIAPSPSRSLFYLSLYLCVCLSLCLYPSVCLPAAVCFSH